MQAKSRTLSLLIAATVALTIAGFVGTAIAPSLLKYHPLWLVALSPLDRHMVLAAAVTARAPFLTVAALRRTLSSALAYGFGSHYGEDGIHFLQARYPGLGSFLTKLLHAVKRASPVVILLAPSTPLCGGLAGAAGIGFVWFVILAATGQLIWATLAYQLSVALGASLKPIIVFLGANVWKATLASVVLVALYAWQRRRRGVIAEFPKKPLAPVRPPETPREL